jgi:hypothetical protein
MVPTRTSSEALRGHELAVASTRAKQSSRGRGTTEYENRLAPRGADAQSIRLQPRTSSACRFFTRRGSVADGNPELTDTRGIFFLSSCHRMPTFGYRLLGRKIASMGCSNSFAMVKASERLGSYRSVSSALTVCRDTFSSAARSP